MIFIKRNVAFLLAIAEMALLVLAIYIVKNTVFTVIAIAVVVGIAAMIFSRVLPKINEARAEIERCIANEKELVFDKEGVYRNYLLFFSPFWLVMFIFMQLDGVAAVIVSVPLLFVFVGYLNKVKVTWAAANFSGKRYWGIQAVVLLFMLAASVVFHVILV